MNLLEKLWSWENSGDRIALGHKIKNQWKTITWSEYISKIEDTAFSLLDLKVKKQQRVALCFGNSYQWACCDFAIQMIGAVTVPIYPNSTPQDIEWILKDSGACLLIGGPNLDFKLENLKTRIADPLSSSKNTDKSVMSWADFEKLAEKKSADFRDQLKKMTSEIELKELASLVYTSGTTGLPKGVSITHRQALAEVSEGFPACGITENDVSLSFLPYSHVFGRIELWGQIAVGYQLWFAQSFEKLKSDLLDVKPTFIASVPRVFEKIHGSILAQMENQKLKQKIFKWAIGVGHEVSRRKEYNESISPQLWLELQIADRMVFSTVKKAFGGRLRIAISGGAPLAEEISRFFHSCGLLILEGYGLTETTAAICVNRPYNFRFGTVGTPLPSIEIKLASDAEIMVRGPQIMDGYWNSATDAESPFVEGWLATGDIGEFLPSGHLRITDRKKDLIKTAGGKYIAPQKLENLLKLNSLVAQVLILGNQKKYVVALITLNIEYSKNSAEVQKQVKEIVSEVNSNLASYESIKRFKILPQQFTIEKSELTPSLKLKRKVIEKTYAKEIDDLYSS